MALHFELHRELADLREDIARLVSDPQFERVRQNYGYEAAREAIDERRRMLAFADAGSVNPVLTIAQIARVERTIRELDPDDVKVLAAINRIGVPTQDPEKIPDEAAKRLHDKRIRLWRESNPSGHILASSGCLEVVTPSTSFDAWDLCDVTKLGEWVLTVMDTFLRVAASDDSGPR